MTYPADSSTLLPSVFELACAPSSDTDDEGRLAASEEFQRGSFGESLEKGESRDPRALNPDEFTTALRPTDAAVLGRSVEPLLRSREISVPAERFRLIEQWEGYVECVNAGDFKATLISLTRTSPEEYWSIPIDEVPRPDASLLQPGAVFYASVGEWVDRYGTIKRGFMLRFRRLPAWSRRELARVASEGAELADVLGIGADTAQSQGGVATA